VMPPEARHLLAAEACLAARKRRKCGEGSVVKEWTGKCMRNTAGDWRAHGPGRL
jgi:hypothetical protein